MIVKRDPTEPPAHHGQHDDCFPCKLSTLHFGKMGPATHAPEGDPWKDNPVVDRIEELTGTRIDTDHLNRRRINHQTPNGSNPPLDT